MLAGCKHDNNLKPPKEDPVYRLPPNDPRYSGPPKFPDNTLNQFPKRVDPGDVDPAAKSPTHNMGMGRGGGMP